MNKSLETEQKINTVTVVWYQPGCKNNPNYPNAPKKNHF